MTTSGWTSTDGENSGNEHTKQYYVYSKMRLGPLWHGGIGEHYAM